MKSLFWTHLRLQPNKWLIVLHWIPALTILHRTLCRERPLESSLNWPFWLQLRACGFEEWLLFVFMLSTLLLLMVMLCFEDLSWWWSRVGFSVLTSQCFYSWKIGQQICCGSQWSRHGKTHPWAPPTSPLHITHTLKPIETTSHVNGAKKPFSINI